MTNHDYARRRRLVGTQKRVARLLGVHPRTISKRECGELEIDREAAAAIRWLELEAKEKEAA